MPGNDDWSPLEAGTPDVAKIDSPRKKTAVSRSFENKEVLETILSSAPV